MKKVIAVITALVLALSCSAIAFAQDYYSVETQADGSKVYICSTCKMPFKDVDSVIKHIQDVHFASTTTTTTSSSGSAKEYVCPGCGKVYYSYREYNDCLDSHNNAVDEHYWRYIGQTLPQIIDTLRNYFVGSQTQTLIFDILYKIKDYVELIIGNYLNAGDVAGVQGAVADLDGALAGVNLDLPELAGVKEFVTSLKQKVKDLYAGEIETSIEETVAEAPAETGSANAGIIVFSVISAAAAAAFVCTKKKAE